MANYLIHTCKERLWYVNDYLIPSMVKQGIDRRHIAIQADILKRGNLENCMQAFMECRSDGGTWHLQDDVLIRRDFKEQTERLDDGIVCGIATRYDRDRTDKIGNVTVDGMWYSFPCIRIPNEIARGCAEWYYSQIVNNPVYAAKVKEQKHDDEIFRMYVKLKCKNIQIINAVPNLVEHIDWLIGGSIVNTHRSDRVQALYFNDDELVKEWEVKLNAVDHN